MLDLITNKEIVILLYDLGHEVEKRKQLSEISDSELIYVNLLEIVPR